MPLCDLLDIPASLAPGACLLGLDYGSVVIGVAISDPGLTVASPLAAIQRKKLAEDAAALVNIIRERKIGALIVGLPKNMDGGEGPTAQAARAFVSNLFRHNLLPDPAMPVAFWDERLSTAAVERFMLENDMSRKRRDQTIDKAAAAYILQGALDRLRRAKTPL
jgi:putative Holliday junction resolvase